MSSPQPIAFAEKNINPRSTDWELQFVAPWQLMYGATNLQTALELRAFGSNVEVRVQYQFADVDPNQPVGFTSAQAGATYNATSVSSSAFQEDTFDLSTDTEMWVQVAVFARLAEAGSETAFVRLWSSVLGAGWVVGRRRIEILGSTQMIAPIGNPFAAADVDGIKLGIRFIDLTGTVTNVGCAARTFTGGDPDHPDSWSVGTTSSVSSGNSNKQCEKASITTANKMLLQAGLQFTASTSTIYGIAEVIAVAKK